MTDHQDLELVQPEKVHLPLWKEDDLSDRDEFVGYPITLKRLCLYLFFGYFAFHGFYPVILFWGYKHFRPFLRPGSKGAIISQGCSFLLPITLFKLCKLYAERSQTRGIDMKLQKKLIPALYLLIIVTKMGLVISNVSAAMKGARIDERGLDHAMDALALLGLPLLFILQVKVNELNKKLLPTKPFEMPITTLEIIGMVACVLIGIANLFISNCLVPFATATFE